MRKKITEDIWIKIEQMHLQDKISIAEICKKLTLNYRTVYYGLKRRKIPITLYKVDKRKYKINDTFFSNINSENKAYLLGFLISDGYITKRNVVNLKLSIIDSYIIKYFRDIISPDKPLYYEKGKEILICGNKVKGNDCCKIEWKSDQMVKDLNTLGVTKNKTSNEVLPAISDKYMPHLIRGIFDGDGSFSLYNKRGKISANIYICSTSLNFLQTIQKYLSFGKIYTESRKRLDMYKLTFNSKSDQLQFYDFLYSESTIFLHRKFYKYAWYANHVLSR